MTELRQLFLKNIDLVMYLVLLITTYFIVTYYKKRALEQLEKGAGSGASEEPVVAGAEDAAKARLSAITGSDVTGQDAGPAAAPEAAPAGEPSPMDILATNTGDGGGMIGGDAPKVGGEQQAVLTQYTAGDGQGVAEIEKMLEKDPSNLQLLDWLAFMYYSNNDVEKAIETYSRITKIDPDNASQHYYLANSYYKVERVDEALLHWRRVVEIKPDGKLARKANDRIKKVEAALNA